VKSGYLPLILDGRSKMVTTIDRAEAPEGLWSIIEELSRLLAGISD